VNYAGGRALILALFVVSVAMTGGIVMTGSTAAADGDAVQFVVAQQNATDEDQNETTPIGTPMTTPRTATSRASKAGCPIGWRPSSETARSS